MIKSLVKNAVLIVAVIGGAVGASFLKSGADTSAESGHEISKSDKKDSHGKADKKGDSHGKKGKDGKDSHASSSSEYVDYLKFKRQFVIPVMKDNKIKSLVIMNFNLELNDKAPSNSFTLEPKLRDAFMRDLLNLSNEGVFDNDITSPEKFEYIRETLLGSSRRIVSSGVENILILDIAKRDN